MKDILCCNCGKKIGYVVKDTKNDQNPPIDMLMCIECFIKLNKE